MKGKVDMSLMKKIALGVGGVAVVLALAVGVAQLTTSAKVKTITTTNQEAQYTTKLFDTSYVHTIDIQMDEADLQDLLENAIDETFYACDITIDGETIKNVGVRAKGNSSLTQVARSDSDRYSFKINFGKYDKGQEYYGLDKMALNNNMADATMMKDYITYVMMNEMGVSSPMVSYSYVTINGQERGLYLNVEDIDESFLERNYGEDYGDLYKPETNELDMEQMGGPGKAPGEMGERPEGEMPQGEIPQGEMSQGQASNQVSAQDNQELVPKEAEGQDMKQSNKDVAPQRPQMGGRTMESNGADLVYVNDDEVSYSSIFDNAETDVTDEDKARLIAAIKQLNEGNNLDEVIDIEATLRYFVVHNFVDNYDSYTGNMLHNYYLYQDNEGKLSMLPWDYNLAFGAFGGMGGGGKMPEDREGNVQAPEMPEDGEGNMQAPEMPTDGAGNMQAPDMSQMKEMFENMDEAQIQEMMSQMGMMGSDATSMVNMAIDTPLSGASEEDRPMWGKLISNETYKEMYHKLFNEFLVNYIESGSILEEINRVQEMITPYVQKDPTAFYNYDEFTKGVETLKQFITLRGESVRGQLNGTIPSTTKEQNAQPDCLIDASSIHISDMGSQSDMMKGTMGDMKNEGMPPQNKEQVEQEAK